MAGARVVAGQVYPVQALQGATPVISPICLFLISEVFDFVHRGADQVAHDILNQLVLVHPDPFYQPLENRLADVHRFGRHVQAALLQPVVDPPAKSFPVLRPKLVQRLFVAGIQTRYERLQLGLIVHS